MTLFTRTQLRELIGSPRSIGGGIEAYIDQKTAAAIRAEDERRLDPESRIRQLEYRWKHLLDRQRLIEAFPSQTELGRRIDRQMIEDIAPILAETENKLRDAYQKAGRKLPGCLQAKTSHEAEGGSMDQEELGPEIGSHGAETERPFLLSGDSGAGEQN
nr:hypothetical protein 12 [Desulfobacteraceae bacterium]